MQVIGGELRRFTEVQVRKFDKIQVVEKLKKFTRVQVMKRLTSSKSK